MGCVASRIDKEERVIICKERKILMKQLLGYRKEFAEAQLAYLRALKNTGVTLRQFTESESLEPEDNNVLGPVLPPSPPPPLPPSPPPPPAFSPELRKFEDKDQVQSAQEEIIEINEASDQTPPPPPVPSSSWEFWYPFDTSSPQPHKRSETVEQEVEEENWAETNTEFVEEDDEVSASASNDNVNTLPGKEQIVELDDNSSMMSWHTKESVDMAMVVWRNKKTLSGIVKDLDDYFLKASAGVKDIAVLIDINEGDTFFYQSIKENKRKRSNSAKVFSALTWSWSSKSLQSTRDTVEFSGSREPCKPGAHCITLQKLYIEEQKLYKEVKEEEVAKIEHERKTLLLQKQDEDHDWTKTEKTRLNVENLQSCILSLQQSIRGSYSTISKLINEELHPQLITLVSGLMHMWQTMYGCHQVQNHISQQLNHLADQQKMGPTTEYHRQAAAQLKTEVTSWYISFCKLVKFQGEYVRALSRWIELMACLVDDGPRGGSLSAVRAIAEEWLRALDKLPDKMASEAIRSFLSAVQLIVLQQQEESSLRKRSNKLERKLDRELNSLSELEMKFGESFSLEDLNSSSNSKHPLSIKRAKVETLKKLVHDGKAKYANSIQVTQAMILNNLRTSLPNVFQSLMSYSSAYALSFKAILSSATEVELNDTNSSTS